MALEGLHHISAITADAARNVDSCARTPGLRLVKRTVGREAPTAHQPYHVAWSAAGDAELERFAGGERAAGGGDA